MKHIFLGLVLLASGAVLAQQSPPPTMPPSTPPTFPEDRAPRQETPPLGEQAEPRQLSTPEQQQIRQGFSAEPMLRNSNVDVQVDESSVTLTGSVKSEEQHDRALRIVESYSGDRKVIDKIKVTQQT